MSKKYKNQEKEIRIISFVYEYKGQMRMLIHRTDLIPQSLANKIAFQKDIDLKLTESQRMGYLDISVEQIPFSIEALDTLREVYGEMVDMGDCLPDDILN